MNPGILFDLDGTLVDSAPDYVAALNELLRHEGRAEVPYESARSVVSQGAMALLRVAFNNSLSPDEMKTRRLELLAIYAQRLTQDTCLFDGVAALLDTLDNSQRGWGIVSNKPTALAIPVVEALGLANRTACLVCGDTLTVAKPSPVPVLHGSEIAGFEPRSSIMIGDARSDIDAGRAAGLLTIATAYGYIPPGEDTNQWNANAVVHNAGELIQEIESLGVFNK